MAKIKILMLHLNYGGAEKQTILMANALANFYDVELAVFYHYPEVIPYQIDPRVKVKYLTKEVPTRNIFWQKYREHKFWQTFLIGLKSLKILYLKKKLIKKEILLNDADIYFSTRTEYGKLLSKYGQNVKLKLTQEHNFIDNEEYFHKISCDFRNLDYVVVISKWHEETYQKYFQNTKVKIVRIPNILENRPKYTRKSFPKSIVAAGRFDKVKDFLSLMEVMKELKTDNIKLYLLGDGIQKEVIKAKVKEYGLEKKVAMPGFVSPREVEEYMQKASIYCLTSQKECFPMVILEAYACGLPVISFDVLSGPRELVKEGKTGYLIKDRDIKEMANKIKALLKDQKLLEDMSKKAYTESSKYTTENIINKWKEILK